MSQQAPANVITVDHPNLIATLDELQADGLIRREIDPDDRPPARTSGDGTGRVHAPQRRRRVQATRR
jgi:hypothetical protein